MNKIPCTISEIVSDEYITLVFMHFKEHCFVSMLLKNDGLKIGMKVNAVFKESEVMICDYSYSKISARNRFVSRVFSVEKTDTIARVVFEFERVKISSLVTIQACEDLEISEGKLFGWFVKSSEVMLEYV
ncbi:hypothetical protein [Helicobacter cappadocius]|uniref:Molybdenum-pterin-binding protein n=1 Tax=Helicobacter cappadocius TaxID=3063998 RepID=A0AA90PT51_9HELI|nr:MULTISPECIES: hypothetical protein [unclassified Helicobacter]MDO7253017.1 hypothetical protein [Helicobacter sp. faydin-H75]MDP2538994.1 hypothetical protein [Helicobacter sp. faydin-H76]